MILRIHHRTSFSYDVPAYESHNEVRAAPAETPEQRCLSFALETDPAAAIFEYADAFGNRVHAVSLHAPHAAFTLAIDAVVERTPAVPVRGRDLSFAEFLAEDDARMQEQHEFLSPSRYVPLSDRLRKLFWHARPAPTEGVAEYTLRLIGFVRDQFEYEPGRTDVHSTVDDVLVTGGGVCQDFAHLAIGLLRLAGVPARYVSGYLAPLTQWGAEPHPSGQATHAWVEALLPGSGWTGFDPTHRTGVQLQHVSIGVGRDYADVPPMRGVYRSRGHSQTMGVEVHVEELSDWQSAAQEQ